MEVHARLAQHQDGGRSRLHPARRAPARRGRHQPGRVAMNRRLLLLLALAGCTSELADTESTAQPIIGGFATDAYPSVVKIESTTGLCSGTLVSPTVILTAAHCVNPSIQAGETSVGSVSF